MPRSEATRGPASMSPGDLDEFLNRQPTAAICFADDRGELFAFPARLLAMSDTDAEVALPTDAAPIDIEDNPPACLVADTFTSYREIRGVIAQGCVARMSSSTANLKASVSVRLSRIRTFSFADQQ
jgi:hypothetical protein